MSVVAYDGRPYLRTTTLPTKGNHSIYIEFELVTPSTDGYGLIIGYTDTAGTNTTQIVHNTNSTQLRVVSSSGIGTNDIVSATAGKKIALLWVFTSTTSSVIYYATSAGESGTVNGGGLGAGTPVELGISGSITDFQCNVRIGTVIMWDQRQLTQAHFNAQKWNRKPVTYNNIWYWNPFFTESRDTTDYSGQNHSFSRQEPGATNVYIRSVGSGGGRDYSTLGSAISDISTIVGSTNLVTSDAKVIFELYDDADFTERVTISGFTCDANRNIVIRAATGQQHNGTLDTGVHFEPTSGSGHIFTISNSHVNLIGLELQQYSGSAASDECVRLGTSGIVGVRIEKCIITTLNTGDNQGDGIYAGSISVGSTTFPIVVRDCIITRFGRAGIHLQNLSGPNQQHFNIINCTFAGCNFGFGFVVVDGGGGGNWRFINCIAIENNNSFSNTGVSGFTFTTTGSTNNFDDNTTGTLPGLGTPNPITATENTSPGAGDFAIFTDLDTYADLSLVDDADNDVIDGGVGPTSSVFVSFVDIRGTARSGSTCEPGAFEIGAAYGVFPATQTTDFGSRWNRGNHT